MCSVALQLIRKSKAKPAYFQISNLQIFQLNFPMCKKFFSVVCGIVLTIFSANAHALWIESNPTAKAGESHEAKIFFGEYGGSERDTVSKWFSNLQEAELWLVSPNGSKEKLATKPELTYLSGAFTPKAEGVYTLLVYLVVKDIHGTAKIEYNASAPVSVGAGAAGNTAAANSNEVSVFRDAAAKPALNKATLVTVGFKGKPSVKETVEVILPGGKEEKFTTDEKGQFSFTPTAAGKYMIEVMHNDKTPGKHNGKDYKSTWKIATELLEVE